MTVTRATAINRAERAISDAYAAWETGKLPSPSTKDLVTYAYDAISDGCRIPDDVGEPIADALFEAQERLPTSRDEAKFIVDAILETRLANLVMHVRGSTK